ncbi:unnamed protein product [Tilletia controversa]|nr:unnamed protein product [Tilletia controversa]
MEPLYNCTISGLIQIDAIEKTQERYHRVDAQFALTASSDHVIYPIGTAYGVHNLEPPMIANITAGFLPFPEPKMNIHSMTQAGKADEVPEGWVPPTPNITGVGKLIKVQDAAKTLRISTSAYDRSANKKRTIEIIGMRDADRKQPVPTEGSTIYFTGKLYSQQETSKLFTMTLDDYSWVSATTSSPSLSKGPSLPEDPSTPTKRPQLGKRKQATQSAEDEAGPSQKKSSSSYASTSSSG